MKKLLAIIFSSLLYFNLSLADDYIEIKKFEKKNIEVLNLNEPPEIEKTCEKCAYLEGGKKFNP